MSTALSIPRKFLATINKEKIILEDINPNLPVTGIKKLYEGEYPEILNASTIDKGVVDGFIVYEFETISGTKG